MSRPAITRQTRANGRAAADSGYAMAVLLVGIAMMGIMLSVAMPVWNQMIKREKEEELIFRGNQYARAVGLYQRKIGGAFPPSLDVLVQQKFLRKKYKDPMVEGGEFQLVPAGTLQAGQVGSSFSTTGSGSTGQSQSRTGTQGTAQGRSATQFGTQTVVTAIAGVVSKSTEKSIKLYNGKDHYNEWLFLYSAPAGRGGGVPTPGGQGGRGRGGQQGPGPGGRGPGGSGPQFPPPQFPPGGRGPGRGQ